MLCWVVADMELFKASHHGDLEKVKAIFQNEAISPETMVKAAAVACKFGQLEVLQYLVAIQNGKIMQCYIDNAAKFNQEKISAWLKVALEKERKEHHEKIFKKADQIEQRKDAADEVNSLVPMKPPSFIPKKVKKIKQRHK